MRSSVEYSFFFFSSRRRHTRSLCDWSSDVCSSDLPLVHWPPCLVNERWSCGCQSWVATTVPKRGISSFSVSTIWSPSFTASAPPGQKSFCTSTTINASCSPTCAVVDIVSLRHAGRARSGRDLLARALVGLPCLPIGAALLQDRFSKGRQRGA